MHVEGGLSSHFIQINYWSSQFLPVLVRSFLGTNRLHVLEKYEDGIEFLWHKFVTETAGSGQSSQRTLPPCRSLPKHVRARHVSEESDPCCQPLNLLSALPLEVEEKSGWLDACAHIGVGTPEVDLAATPLLSLPPGVRVVALSSMRPAAQCHPWGTLLTVNPCVRSCRCRGGIFCLCKTVQVTVRDEEQGWPACYRRCRA